MKAGLTPKVQRRTLKLQYGRAPAKIPAAQQTDWLTPMARYTLALVLLPSELGTASISPHNGDSFIAAVVDVLLL